MTARDDAIAVLLEDCVVAAEPLVPLLMRLRQFSSRYAAFFQRSEQADRCHEYLQGLLSTVERKSIEPIANALNRPRRALQHFVGAGRWDDQAVLAELRLHAAEELGDPAGILIIDPTSFVKKGCESVGVKRQYCGRLGKVENCQVGLFIGYASPKGHTLVHAELHVPEDWATDSARRAKCYVPEEVTFRTMQRMTSDWLMAHGHQFPHGWVVADEEFGKSGSLRETLRDRKERFLLRIQGSRTVRLIDPRQPKGRRDPETGRRRQAPFQRVDTFARAQPPSAWKSIRVRDGERGPIEVQALKRKVQTKSAGRIATAETLLVTRTVGVAPEYRFSLSSADLDTPLEEMALVASERPRIEEDFQRAKGEVGLADYEVRSWIGWHHHMTLAMLAQFFLVVEQGRLGELTPAITVQQVAVALEEFVLNPEADPQRVAKKITHQLKRNEQSRISHWRVNADRLPPPRFPLRP
jgi:SRSO17 transposase